MHDVEAIEHFESLEELSEDDQGLSFWQVLFLLELILQSALVAVFVDEVDVVPRLEVVLVFDDVLAGPHGRQNFHLVDHALFESGVFCQLAYWNYFDCELSYFG